MADETLRVDPAVLQDSAIWLGGASARLSAELSRLDDRVGQLLGGWHGAAGTAYGAAWDLWHRGAREVELGLAMLSHAVGQAGGAYRGTEADSARAERAVCGG